MTRAEVTDRGLSRRLGERVSLATHEGGEEKKGRLVYFPNRYAIKSGHEVVPIQHGDIVGLRRGKGCASHEESYLHYKYLGN